MTAPDPSGVIEWLAGGARSGRESHQVLAELCERLCACGVPLWHAEVFVRTLHPQVTGRHFKWKAGTDAEVTAVPFELFDTEEFRQNPIAHVCLEGVAIRRKPADNSRPVAFPALGKLFEKGVTEFLAAPLVFTDGEVHAAVWTTRQAEGFTKAQISAIEAIMPPLARVAEVRALRRTATNLLDTYLGNHTGERILAGQVRRGHVESIHAAIWLSDLRGFTGLTDRLAPRKVVEVLNRYFDCQVPAIRKRSGEVLKFMGDGLLAIFPIPGNNGDPRKVCTAALEAGLEARANVAACEWSSLDEHIGPIRFGLALHVGEVLYGNIGGGDRLDFTCIGPAINLAARLEKFTATEGRVIVTSETFARHCQFPLEPVGEFPIRGLDARQMVFGLPDEPG
ncbi:MAG TPA: adenylate/guanylate cyclase domain-containing protein [Candidatus Binatia bacterium]|jgi:adenylate cyclase|nr:adenylate/guanylate cyclase domain-containing protein [Candidatus Binatia bacterium]